MNKGELIVKLSKYSYKRLYRAELDAENNSTSNLKKDAYIILVNLE